MSTITLWFDIVSDYREGMSVNTYTKPPKESEDDDYEDGQAPESACEIKANVPEKNYTIFIANEFPNYEIIWQKDITDFKKTYQKIFSQVYDFIPDVNVDIKNMPAIIDEELIKRIKDDGDDGYYFVFAIDSKGEVVLAEII